jgi:CDP-glycerol glycerophosphotransferase (TagB/SpsB family)
MGHYASHRHHRIFEKRTPRFEHAVLIPMHDYNILPLMSVADTLISEASSTIFDFLALEKFGVIYDLDYDRLKHSDGEHILSLDNREFLRDAFVHINSPDEIGAAVRQALNPTKKMQQAAAESREYFFYNLDGKASGRFKKVVENLLLDGSHFNEP